MGGVFCAGWFPLPVVRRGRAVSAANGTKKFRGAAPMKGSTVMANIKIVGDAMVVVSSHTLEDIQTLEKYAPKALSLYEANEDGKREEVFKVCTTTGAGSVGKYGVSFSSSTHDEAKLAAVTLCIPADVEDAKEYAADQVGYAVMKLNQVEAQIPEALRQVEAERAEVLRNISVG